MSSESKDTFLDHFQFLRDKFTRDSDMFFYIYTASVFFSTVICPYLIHKSIQKIKRIMLKESYCVISVWLNILSVANLSVQTVFNFYQLDRILFPEQADVFDEKVDVRVILVFSNVTMDLSTCNIVIQLYEWLTMLLIISV